MSILAAGAIAVAVAVTGVEAIDGDGPSAPAQAATALDRPCGGLAGHRPHIRQVVWIWMENRAYSHVMNKPLPRLLASRCGLAANYHNLVHGSVQNYLASVSGTLPPFDSVCQEKACPQPAVTLFEQVSRRGQSWRAYAESMVSNCQLKADGAYAVRHNPAVYFTRIRHQCARWDQPLGDLHSGALARDFRSHHPPAFALITPNLCDDMHNCPATAGEVWLRSWLSLIVSSRSYRAGDTAVFLTWDEGTAASHTPCQSPADPQCHVATFVMSMYTRPGTVSTNLYTHYSLLGTTERLLGLPLLGGAQQAGDMRAAFGLAR